MKKASAIILAAGLSTRMGQHKFMLKLPNGKTFLDEIIGQFCEFGCAEIIVVLNKDGVSVLNSSEINLPENARVVENSHPEWERFYSLQCGLNSLSEQYPVFVHNVDNPFVNPEVLEKLFTHLNDFDYAKPVYNGKGGHPILLSEKIQSTIRNEDLYGVTIKEYLRGCKTKKVAIDDNRILVNVNSKKDFKAVKSRFLKS